MCVCVCVCVCILLLCVYLYTKCPSPPAEEAEAGDGSSRKVEELLVQEYRSSSYFKDTKAELGAYTPRGCRFDSVSCKTRRPHSNKTKTALNMYTILCSPKGEFDVYVHEKKNNKVH